MTLGSTGIKTTRIAQGTGWNGGDRSSAHTRLGEKAFTEAGSPQHRPGHRVHRHRRSLRLACRTSARALKGVPQDKYIVLSKIWPRKEFWNSPSGGAKEEVDRFRKELNRDVLDICLIHCMTDGQWPTEYRAHPR